MMSVHSSIQDHQVPELGLLVQNMCSVCVCIRVCALYECTVCVYEVGICACVCVCLLIRLQSLVPEHNLVIASYDIIRNDVDFFR